MDNREDLENAATEVNHLVSAKSKLEKTEGIIDTRAEQTNLNSITEFILMKPTNELNPNEIENILGDTAELVKISNPLENPHASRTTRPTGNDETKEKIARWDPIVARSRTVDYASFPLKKVTGKSIRGLRPPYTFLSKFKFKPNLQKETEEFDPPLVTEDEEESVPQMSLETVEHRQQVGEVNSKEFLQREELKESEEFLKEDPEEALKRLLGIENVKNQTIRSNYNNDVRQQTVEQLDLSRSLTRKIQYHDNTDGEVSINPWLLPCNSDSSTKTEASEFNIDPNNFIRLKETIFFNNDPLSDLDEYNQWDDDDGEQAMRKINLLKFYEKECDLGCLGK